MGLMKGGGGEREKACCLADTELKSNTSASCINVSITANTFEICDFRNIKKANLQATVGGQPDLPGTNFNLYSACLYQRWLEPKKHPYNILFFEMT